MVICAYEHKILGLISMWTEFVLKRLVAIKANRRAMCEISIKAETTLSCTIGIGKSSALLLMQRQAASSPSNSCLHLCSLYPLLHGKLPSAHVLLQLPKNFPR